MFKRRDKMRLQTRLRECRKQNGLTQQQVARRLNIDRSTYSYYETGKICPSINSISTLCEFYGMSIDEFLNGTDVSVSEKAAAKNAFSEIAASTEDEKKLLTCYRKLDSAQKEDFLISIIETARQKD